MNRALLPPAHRLIRPGALAGLLLSTALATAACGTPVADSAESSAPVSAVGPATSGGPSSSTSSNSYRSTAVRLDSGWAKAGSGMTAVFGTVVNQSGRPVTIVGGSSPAAASVQVHTMAKQPDGSMKMTEKKGGLTVPAGGSAVLAPGADHVMLLGLRAPLANGEDVSLVMLTADGLKLEWTVPVRAFSGAEETYAPQAHS